MTYAFLSLHLKIYFLHEKKETSVKRKAINIEMIIILTASILSLKKKPNIHACCQIYSSKTLLSSDYEYT